MPYLYCSSVQLSHVYACVCECALYVRMTRNISRRQFSLSHARAHNHAVYSIHLPVSLSLNHVLMVTITINASWQELLLLSVQVTHKIIVKVYMCVFMSESVCVVSVSD